MIAIPSIHSFNFILFRGAGYSLDAVKKQIDDMVEKCAINTVNFIVMAGQEHTYSTEILWQDNPRIPEDEDLVALFRYAKDKGLRRIMKPMVNPMDGYWRAFIRFFDEDVACEPKWSQWFASYTAYIRHYAVLSEQEGVEMLIAGCELVGTDHREAEWRALIADVRKVYSGLVTYNCDKYQEHNVKWWDACDVISSSGYYPVNDWPRQTPASRRWWKIRQAVLLLRGGLPVHRRFGHDSQRLDAGGQISRGSRGAGELLPHHVRFVRTAPLALRIQHLGLAVPREARLQSRTDAGYAVIDKPAGDYIKLRYQVP
jgi:hypothetical protein